MRYFGGPRSSVILALALWTAGNTHAATGVTEPFDSPAGPLFGVTDGTGWSGAWTTQNNSATMPGYNIAISLPLQYLNLAASAAYATGGDSYQWTGRTFDTTDSGPLAPWLNQGKIGAPGTTLWFSMLMRKDAETDQENSVSFHSNRPAWWPGTPPLQVGYFGSASNVSGQRFWSLKAGGVVYRTNTPIRAGETALLVLRFDFAAAPTIRLYVNPTSLGADPPLSAATEMTNAAPVEFDSIAFFGGESAGQSSIDEIRIGDSFAAVTPTSGASGAPPVPAGLTAIAGNAAVSLSWKTSPGASSYHVRRSTTSGGPYATIAEVPASSFTDATVLNGTRYYYSVSALNSFGESAGSADVPALPLGPPPARPQNVTPTSGDRLVSLQWAAASGATGYRVKRANTSGGPFVQVATISSASFYDRTVVNGLVYFYVVSSMNASGESADSDQVVSAPMAPAVISAIPIGINVEAVTDYAVGQMFADVMRSARLPFLPGSFTAQAPLDPDGWPLSDCDIFLADNMPNMGGIYKLTFTGQATPSIQLTASSITNLRYDAATNTTSADVQLPVTGRQSVMLRLRNTQRMQGSPLGSGVTRIRMLRPGYGPDATFTTPFKSLLSRFSVIRFLEWTSINSQQIANWTDRTLPTYAWQGARTFGVAFGSPHQAGVAWEYCIQLANETGKDLYINIPHRATADYVRQLALLIRSNLRSSLKVYVEFSNETWNSAYGFSQVNELRDMAIADAAANPIPLNFDGVNDPGGWTYQKRFVAKRIVEISGIFRSVFGDAAMMTRIRPTPRRTSCVPGLLVPGKHHLYRQLLRVREHRQSRSSSRELFPLRRGRRKLLPIPARRRQSRRPDSRFHLQSLATSESEGLFRSVGYRLLTLDGSLRYPQYRL